MKLCVQKDLDISQVDLSQASRTPLQFRIQGKRKLSQRTQDHRKTSSVWLKKGIQKLKVQAIKKQFVHKLKSLIPHSNVPQQLLAFQKQSDCFLQRFLNKFGNNQGLKMNTYLYLLWRLIIFMKVVCMVVLSSLLLVFQQLQFQQKAIKIVQICLILSIVDILSSFVFQKFQNNKNLKTITQISKSYIKNDFALDFLTLLFSGFLRIFDGYISVLLLIVSLIKLWRCIYKIQFLQHIYIANVSNENYYTIIRVFFFNFLIGHFMAIILLLMAKINLNDNWISANHLINCGWVQQYTWSYYWAINIMLTVGFGDISATNKDQALVLIFVESISCIFLAYNINVVGSILTDMKQRERDRKKQLRILLSMAKQNQINNQLLEQVISYVDQSYKIKQKFLYEDHDSIIQTLPQSIQSQYKKQTNRKIIIGLPLVNFFSQKGLLRVAEKITRKIAHPQQVIWKKDDPLRLIILNQGKLGLACNKQNSKINGQIIHFLEANSKKSKILTINFIKNQRFIYDIKSLKYGVIYHLSCQQFGQALSQKLIDYQMFCMMRDQLNNKEQSGELYNCKYCNGERHDYFSCPKIHLMILKGHVISKHTGCRKNISTSRIPLQRRKGVINFIKSTKKLKQDQLYFLSSASLKSGSGPKLTTFQQFAAMSQKLSTSIRSNMPLSHIFRELDIQKLNSLFLAKMNEQEICKGFWELQCDLGYNFASYFKLNNPKCLKDCSFNINKSRLSRINSFLMNSFLISQKIETN